MRSARWYALVAVAAIAAAMRLPLSPALSSGDARQARFVAAIVTAAVCTAFAAARGGRPALWSAVSILSGAAALALLLAHVNANQTCLATYNGRAILVGRELTPPAADYVRRNPG